MTQKWPKDNILQKTTNTINMKKLFKSSRILFIVLSLLASFSVSSIYSHADTIVPISEDIALDEDTGGVVYNFLVYDEYGKIIFERSQIEIGDIIINSSFDKYEIVEIDFYTRTAKAKFLGKVNKPQIVKEGNTFLSNNGIEKKIGLYMTHNDESYVIGDGVSSINGAGGIHDIAKKLSTEFSKLGITVDLREDIHNPHNSSAYSRSNATAKSLLDAGNDAIFDIHRDGVASSVYVKKIDGIERCKVRIVVGQANPNKEVNLQFATYLFAVAEEYCPWLFLDIYYAKGHYNQALSSKALLFEMGTYLAEKDLVASTVPYLANVVNTTLYSATIENSNPSQETGSVENVETSEKVVIKEEIQKDETISNLLDIQTEQITTTTKHSNKTLKIVLGVVFALILTAFVVFIVCYYFFKVQKDK